MTGGSTSPSRRWPFLLAAAAICAALAWFFLHGRHGRNQETATAPAHGEPVAAAEEPRVPPARPRIQAQPEHEPYHEPYKEETVTSDGVPIAPARGEVTGPAHPHPITPQHQRIYGENRLVGAIEGAMEVKDVPGMRRLVEQYRREYPEDDQELQDGYAAIVDCMERPGAATRAAAERWLDSHNGSTAKRYVVRYCLEPPQQP